MEERGRVALDGDAPGEEHGDAVAVVVDVGEHVGGEHDGRAARACLAEQVLDDREALGVDDGRPSREPVFIEPILCTMGHQMPIRG